VGWPHPRPWLPARRVVPTVGLHQIGDEKIGSLYGVTTLEHFAEMTRSDWLEAVGFTLPANPLPSRYPTEEELRKVLDSLDGYSASYQIDAYTCFADVTSAQDRDGPQYIGVRLTKPLRDEHPTLAFEKGSDRLVLMIVEKLSHVCGPLVLDSDLDGAPVLVTPGIDIDSALEGWLALAERIQALTSGGRWHSR